MKSAAKPSVDDSANYRNLASIRMAEGQPRLRQIESQVLAQYARYDSVLNDSSGPIPHGWGESDRIALRENYRYLSRAQFRALRGAILSAAGGLCPYCHHLNASEVDHFLPKARFGEYAILSENLVPICSTCNPKKSVRYKSSGGRGRRYAHPYFDSIPSEQFLWASVEIGSTVTLDYSISLSSGVSEPIAARLQAQFADFGLAARFGDEATQELGARLWSLYVYFDLGGAKKVSEYLHIECVSSMGMFGRNHWLPVALGSLSSSEAFCDGGFKLLGPAPELP